MSFTIDDKVRFLADTEKNIINNHNNTLYLKALANFVYNSRIKTSLDFSNLDEELLQDSKRVRSELQKIFQEVAEIAQSKTIVKTYTTGQLAKFLDVSITTINNWIKEGRFIGVKRSKENKQARISETTVFINRAGKEMTVTKIAELYEKEQAELLELENNDYDQDEFTFLMNQCARFEEKYNGEYHQTLGLIDEEKLNAKEQADAATWAYFVKRLEFVNRTDSCN